MVQKRPLDAEHIFEVSFKLPKHVGPSNQLVSFPKSVFLEDACQLTKYSEGERRQVIIEGNEKPESDNFELPGGAGDSETSLPGGSISVSSWATSSTIEDVQSESPRHLPIVPEYFSPDRPLRTLVRYDDIYSLLLGHPPRKLVSVGANYQADIPALDLSVASSRSEASDGDEGQKRFMGTRIIRMPRMESTYDNDKVGKGRTDCSCDDRGSVRCVRQHIVEVREELIKNLGHESFTKLGFSEMGEQVAEKWSAKDEQIFHEFVVNNPSSLDKNFWNNLSVVLSSRTKKEIVSYYFNVLMLQRRTKQNRNELWNIDSDNDEWQGSDGNEVATREEDEDSIAEFPVCQDDTGLTSCHRNDLVDFNEYAAEEPSDVNGNLDFTNRDIGVDSKYDHWFGDPNGGSNNGCSQGYALEPCDAKVYESSFFSCSKNNTDSLTTCNMIKEVLGDGRRQETR